MAGSTVQIDGSASANPEPAHRGRWAGVLACTAAVILCEALVFRYLFQYGVSDISRVDSITQHFPAFLYVHEWMTAILSGHGASYGLWSWRLGLGSDVLTTLSYYVADPFALISLLFPVRLLEYVYEGLFFLRIICAGLAGYAYLRTIKASRLGAVAGTLIYVFAGFMMVMGLRHPYFVDGMVWFPLVLVGIERVLHGRRWHLLVIAVFLAAASNFYLFYQIGIIAVIYALARWWEITKPGERLRRLAADAGRTAGWFALGTALAAFMLVPMALAVLASSRESTSFGWPLLYSAKTYASYVVALISARTGSNGLYAGFAAVGLIAAGLLFLRRGNSAIKTMLVTFGILLVFPFFGRMMNGFSYANYRSFFMAGIFFGACVALLLTDPEPLSRRELKMVGIGFAAFAAADTFACWRLGYHLILVAVPIGLGIVSWALLGAERLVRDAGGARPGADPDATARAVTILRLALVGVIVAGIAASGIACYDEHFNATLKTHLKLGTALSRYTQDAGSLARTLPTQGLQRIDKQQGVMLSDLEASQSNDPLAQGYAGLDFYYSVMGDGMHEYAKALADRSKRLPFDIEGFDDRAALDTLAGVRYYIAPSYGRAYVPYGFVRRSVLGTETVYENRYALPIGYVYHSVIAPATFAAMSPLDRQQALLQGVVIANGQAPSLPRITPAPETLDVTYTLTPGEGLTWDPATSTFVSSKKGAAADLSFSAVPDAELYLDMSGFTFGNPKQLTMAAQAVGPRKIHRIMAIDRGYFWGDHGLLVNLGYHATGTTSARLLFLAKDTVHYTSLKIVAVPMARYAQHVEALASQGMRDVTVSADTLSGTVTSNGSGVLFLSIPFTTGWSATIDGAPATIVEASDGFSGIAVSSGNHRIVLRYSTPGLRTGIVISLLALLLAIAIAVLGERRSRSHHARTRRAASDARDVK